MAVKYSSNSNENFKESIESLTSVIPQIIRVFEKQIKRISPQDRPTEASVEFGLLLTTEASIAVTRGNADSNLKVTLTWIDDTIDDTE